MAPPVELVRFGDGKYRIMFTDNGPWSRVLIVEHVEDHQFDGDIWDECSSVPTSAVMELFQKMYVDPNERGPYPNGSPEDR